MKLNLKRKFQRFCLILICLVVLIFQSDIPNLKALPMDNYQGEIVIEELRLKVPADAKAVWLNAEKRNMGAMVIFSRWFFGETIILG